MSNPYMMNPYSLSPDEFELMIRSLRYCIDYSYVQMINLGDGFGYNDQLKRTDILNSAVRIKAQAIECKTRIGPGMEDERIEKPQAEITLSVTNLEPMKEIIEAGVELIKAAHRRGKIDVSHIELIKFEQAIEQVVSLDD